MGAAWGIFPVAARIGGAIEVASEVGEGSNFTLWLPLADASSAAVVDARAINGGRT